MATTTTRSTSTTRSKWNLDPLNHGWSLWRRLGDADDPRKAIEALKRDDLRCVVLAQLLEHREQPAASATGQPAPAPLARR